MVNYIKRCKSIFHITMKHIHVVNAFKLYSCMLHKLMHIKQQFTGNNGCPRDNFVSKGGGGMFRTIFVIFFYYVNLNLISLKPPPPLFPSPGQWGVQGVNLSRGKKYIRAFKKLYKKCNFARLRVKSLPTSLKHRYA